MWQPNVKARREAGRGSVLKQCSCSMPVLFRVECLSGVS